MEYAIIFKFYLLFLPLFYWSEKGRDLFNTKHLGTHGIRCKHSASSIGIYHILKNVPTFLFQSKKKSKQDLD